MLANGGTLLRPRLADALIDSKGEVAKEFKTEPIRQVLSEESCRSIRKMMVGVGRYGTGKRAYVPGVEAAYKTGTSSRALFGADYDNYNTHTAVCLLPADEPKYVIYAAIHDVENQYLKAAQVFVREVADYLAERDNIPREYKAYDYNFLFRRRYLDNVIGLSYTEGQRIIFHSGFVPVLSDSFSSGDLIACQYPSPGLDSGYNSRIWLSDNAEDLPGRYVTLPDFTGLTAEEALREARRLELNIAFEGTNRAGVITSQQVAEPELAGGSEAGDKVRIYSLITLEFAGDDAPGPYADDSLTEGYDDGSGEIYW